MQFKRRVFDITIINEIYHAGITSAASTDDKFYFGDDVACWNTFRWNLLPPLYTVNPSRPVVTLTTPVHSGLLAILPSLAIFPSSTVCIDIMFMHFPHGETRPSLDGF
jgi:hypothetical protein